MNLKSLKSKFLRKVSVKREKGAFEINQNNSKEDKKTFIVLGTVRAGTTMVAGVMSKLGVYMGEIDKENYEDNIMSTRDRPKMKEHIENNNLQHNIWGWKYPQAAVYLDDILGDVRNPHLIFVYRDMMAAAAGRVRWHNCDLQRALMEVHNDYQANLSIAMRYDYPQLHISYEKAVRHPDLFIEDLKSFCGIMGKTTFDYKRFMAPESYKSLTEKF